MKYRKITADTIFDGYQFLENQVLLVEDTGLIGGVVSQEEAGEDVEKFQGILTPGFVNCHCHLELSHLKGRIPEKTGLVDFVFKIVTERHHPDAEILEAIAEAEDEMLRSGIVAVGDICNNALTLEQKQKGRLHYYNFIEAIGWLPALSQTRFESAKALFDQYAPASRSIVPHAPYSVSENLWQQLQPYFCGKVVSIHNQETAFEDEFFLEGTGDFQRMYQLMKMDNTHHRPTQKSSLQSYFEKLKGASSILLVHNTFTRQQDIDFVQAHTSSKASVNEQALAPGATPSTFFCLCVNANQYIENALPPVELLRQNHCSIVLGTDSLASNWSLNILDEVRTIRKHFPSISLEEILGWATLNGARALQMDSNLGSFEKGKRSGVVVVDEERLIAQRIL